MIDAGYYYYFLLHHNAVLPTSYLCLVIWRPQKSVIAESLVTFSHCCYKISNKSLLRKEVIFLAHNLEAKSIMAAKGSSIWSYYIASSTRGLKKIDAGTYLPPICFQSGTPEHGWCSYNLSVTPF